MRKFVADKGAPGCTGRRTAAVGPRPLIDAPCSCRIAPGVPASQVRALSWRPYPNHHDPLKYPEPPPTSVYYRE